ncbi:MAG: DUF2723 domain-containing protein [bacterium]|nr:DUF2723 domain-containing protein [bacterium]
MCTVHIGPGGRSNPGDAAKFQYIPCILGVPHAPGFPLYILCAWLWSHLNVCLSQATMSNLLSAVFMAAALVCLHRSFVTAGVSAFCALLTCFALLIAPRFWTIATQAGPTAMSILLAAANFFAGTTFFLNRSPKSFAATLMLGLLGAGHDTVLLWWAPLLIGCLTCVAPSMWRLSLTCLALGLGLLLCLCPHLYTYIRSWQIAPVLEYVGPRVSLPRLAAFVLGAQFWPNYFHLPLRAIVAERFPLLIHDLLNQLHISLAALAVPGLLVAWLSCPRIALLLSSALLANLFFALHQYAPDPPALMYLATLAWAFAGALGLDCLLRQAGRLRPVLNTLAVACLLSHAFVSARSFFGSDRDFRVRNLLLGLPAHALVLTKDVYGTSQLLAYYHYTDEFIRQRSLSARDALDPSTTNPVFFFERSVYDDVLAAGFQPLLVTSNAHGTMYLLSGGPSR